ncbi:MAG: glutathione S-transferase N-terminal domain-containing protein [Candidatus Marinimicrobia bacterium]|nr:glutathione S-transferase N-terminal domain-containing protein [Candidatus Neomarinimicrobiota bacterium]
MRARMALTKIDLTIELREILLRERPPQIYAISPKGTVPVLHLPDGQVIDESVDILHWVFNQIEDSNDISNQVQLVDLIDGEFKHWLDRYKYSERYPEHSQFYYQERGNEILTEFENKLGENSFFGGKSPGFTDMAVFPLIRQFAHVNVDAYQESFTRLYDYYRDMHAHICFTSVMDKYSQWQEGDTPLLVNFYVPENTEKLTQQTPL